MSVCVLVLLHDDSGQVNENNTGVVFYFVINFLRRYFAYLPLHSYSSVVGVGL